MLANNTLRPPGGIKLKYYSSKEENESIYYTIATLYVPKKELSRPPASGVTRTIIIKSLKLVATHRVNQYFQVNPVLLDAWIPAVGAVPSNPK